LKEAVRLRPTFADAWQNLSHSFFVLGLVSESEAAARRAIQLNPSSSGALNNLGNALYPQYGKLDEAIMCFHEAIRLNPANEMASSNLLFCLNNHPDRTTEEIFQAYRDWAARHELKIVDQWEGFPNTPDEGRRIRIGYISPDFRKHSMRYFLLPLIENHNHKQFELYLYADNIESDEYTERYHQKADVWKVIRHLDDDAVWRMIRADAVDILVDLAGHTAGNRLGVFARRAAPIQVSYLGFGFTTGLRNMDYFITDEHFVPTSDECFFSEQIFRLERPQYVYRADTEYPVGVLPYNKTNRVTFGCFSRTIRFNHRVIKAWAKILAAVPNSRLLLNTRFLLETALENLLLMLLLQKE